MIATVKKSITVEEALELFDKQIEQMVSKFARRFFFETDELRQEVAIIFLKKWDDRPEYLDGPKFVSVCVYRGLIDYTTAQQKKRVSLPHQQVLERSYESTTRDSDLFLSLSDDAQDIVKLMLDAPAELVELMHSSKGRAASVINQIERFFSMHVGREAAADAIDSFCREVHEVCRTN